MNYGIKQVITLKNNNILLHKLTNICFDKYLNDSDNQFSFEYLLFTDFFKGNNQPNIYFCRSNSYYDAFAGDIFLSELKCKLPLEYYAI